MKKFAVFSGFLGSGKTSTMMALTKYFTSRHGLAAMISNDLGSQSLADNRLAILEGCKASELIGDCICYQREKLAARLDSLFEEGCELIISDIPGFGVGALDHVYHGLEQDFPGRYELAPFTVIVEKPTVDALRGGSAGDIGYILNTQLVEADLIVLNKTDLLSPDEKAETAAWLRESYPHAEVVAISALSGDGLDELSRALIRGKASMRLPDIGYGGEAFGKAMGGISEYYIQYHATVCCEDFDGSAYLTELGERVRAAVRAAGREIPHLKLLAWESEGDFGKADLIGVDRELILTRAFQRPCTEISVMLNASAICPGEELNDIMADAIDSVSRDFQLELMIFKHECFGMGG